MERCNRTRIYIIIMAAFLLIYIFIAAFYPPVARLFQIIHVLLLLSAASFYDVLENRIPLFLCIGVLLINIFYSVFYEWDLGAWIAGAIIILALSAIFIINKKAIGTGDILILGFSVPAMPLPNLFMFLFLTFMMSSVLGLIKGIKAGKFTGTTIPLAPCIAFSFFIVALLNNL